MKILAVSNMDKKLSKPKMMEVGAINILKSIVFQGLF